MKINFHVSLVLIGILIASVIVMQNIVAPVQAYVLIWIKNTAMLALVSIAT